VHTQKVLERVLDSFTWGAREIVEGLSRFGFSWWFSLREGQHVGDPVRRVEIMRMLNGRVADRRVSERTMHRRSKNELRTR
jgi:hypothetical protein